MKKIQGLVLVLTLGVASLAHAQATRTWVSGVGDDVNPCSRTAPCKTFAGAISKTATGGIINVLDPGGFGAVTITKSITIDGSPFMAGVLASGTNGIIISGAGAVVTLRGLDIEGVSGATNGVRVLNAANVTIENCQIFGYQRGISFEDAATLNANVTNCTIKNNSSHGIGVFPTGGTSTRVDVNNCVVTNNGGNGIEVGAASDAYITRSTFAHNTVGGLVTDAANSFISAEEVTSSHNQFGVFSGTSGAASILLSRCNITKNTSQGIAKSGDGSGALGSVTGFQNNVINSNTGDNAVTSSLAQQ